MGSVSIVCTHRHDSNEVSRYWRFRGGQPLLEMSWSCGLDLKVQVLKACVSSRWCYWNMVEEILLLTSFSASWLPPLWRRTVFSLAFSHCHPVLKAVKPRCAIWLILSGHNPSWREMLVGTIEELLAGLLHPTVGWALLRHLVTKTVTDSAKHPDRCPSWTVALYTMLN